MTTPGVSVKHTSGGVTIEIPIFRSDSLLAAQVIELQTENARLEEITQFVRDENRRTRAIQEHLATINAGLNKDCFDLREQNQRLHALLHATPPIQSIDAQVVKDNRELRAEIKRLTEAGIGTIGELVAALDNLQQANRRVAKLRDALMQAYRFAKEGKHFVTAAFIAAVAKEAE